MTLADIHNHLRVNGKSLEGDLNKVADFSRARLMKGGIVGIVNLNDFRYENLVNQPGYDRTFFGNGNCLAYIPEKEICIIKGQEIETNQGNILVFGVDSKKNIRSGKNIEETIKEAKDYNSTIILTNPFYAQGIGEYLIKKHEILQDIDAIEIHNSEAEFGFPIGPIPEGTNEESREFYEHFVSRVFPGVGAISSSDGHSFNEIGSSYTSLYGVEKKNFNESFKKAIRQTDLSTFRKNGSSKKDAAKYFIKKIFSYN